MEEFLLIFAGNKVSGVSAPYAPLHNKNCIIIFQLIKKNFNK